MHLVTPQALIGMLVAPSQAFTERVPSPVEAKPDRRGEQGWAAGEPLPVIPVSGVHPYLA